MTRGLAAIKQKHRSVAHGRQGSASRGRDDAADEVAHSRQPGATSRRWGGPSSCPTAVVNRSREASPACCGHSLELSSIRTSSFAGHPCGGGRRLQRRASLQPQSRVGASEHRRGHGPGRGRVRYPLPSTTNMYSCRTPRATTGWPCEGAAAIGVLEQGCGPGSQAVESPASATRCAPGVTSTKRTSTTAGSCAAAVVGRPETTGPGRQSLPSSTANKQPGHGQSAGAPRATSAVRSGVADAARSRT